MSLSVSSGLPASHSQSAGATLALAVVSSLYVAHLVAVALSLETPEQIPVWHDVFGWVASGVGVAGTWLAMRVFSPGDHLRRVWTLFFISALLLLVGTALRSYWLYAAPGQSFIASPLIIPRALVVISANVTATLALTLLVGTYRRSGLQAPWTPPSLLLWFSVAAVAAVLCVRSFQQLWVWGSAAQNASTLTGLASTLGDTITIILIVPALRVAYLMRGGRLGWVWWAMGLSGAAWLLYDGRDWLAALLPGEPASNLELLRVLRTPGLALVGLAGFFQREALRAR